jgi:YesN/AraC family two-component response regulator
MAAPAGFSGPTSSPLTVLIVDDEPDMRHGLRDLLELMGHRVLEAANGVEALARIAQERVTIIITDLYMPKMDGVALLAKIQQSESPPRLIAMSGVFHLARSAATLGLFDPDVILEKPFTSEELQGALAKAVAKSGEAA